MSQNQRNKKTSALYMFRLLCSTGFTLLFDRIVVMRDGRIVETGKHSELLARGDFYAELFNSQFEVTDA